MAISLSESSQFPGGGYFSHHASLPAAALTSSSGETNDQFHVPRRQPVHHVQIQNESQNWWRFLRLPSRSYWTKYCLLCTICGSAATILAGIFLVVAALFRYYTTSIHYFETIPTYIPAVLLCICGVSTIAFSWKKYRNIILLKITACWSLVNSALCSVITITTSLIHMNRLQTIRECVYEGRKNPPSCTCVAHGINLDNIGNGFEPVHYVFENTPDCGVIHGTLYSCLRAVFAISVIAVLLSIFLCMLLYQLIGPMARDRSSMFPLAMSPSGLSIAGGPAGVMSPIGLLGWGPPPPYEEIRQEQLHRQGMMSSAVLSPDVPQSSNIANAVLPTTSSPSPQRRRESDEVSDTFVKSASAIFPEFNAHPFSPTITSLNPDSSHRNTNPFGRRQLECDPDAVAVESSADRAHFLQALPLDSPNTCLQSSGTPSQPNPVSLPKSSKVGSRSSGAPNSLPNSPILMNVKRLVNIRYADRRAKKFCSSTKLYHTLESRVGANVECSNESQVDLVSGCPGLGVHEKSLTTFPSRESC